MGGSPVGHDVTLEAHVPLQIREERLRVLAGVDVVDLVVAAHERADSGVNGGLEHRVVHLVASPLVDVGGHRAAVGLLVVVHPVLGVGQDLVGLGLLNHMGHKSGSEHRVLPAHVLKVPSVDRNPSDIEPGTEHDVGTLVEELLAHLVAPEGGHLRVPSRSDVETGRKGSGGTRPCIIPEALRSIIVK